MANTVSRAPIVRQYALSGTPTKLTDLPYGIVAARMVSSAPWSFGDTPATAIFPVPADLAEELPTAGIADTYFVGTQPLIVAFFV